MTKSYAHLNREEFKAIVQSARACGLSYWAMDFTNLVVEVKDSIGPIVSWFVSVLAISCATINIMYLVDMHMPFSRLGIYALSPVLIVVLMYLFGFRFCNFFSKLLCNTLIETQESLNFLPQLDELWKQLAPKESKTDRYYKAIINCQKKSECEPHEVVAVVHRLRIWVREAEFAEERERRSLENVERIMAQNAALED